MNANRITGLANPIGSTDAVPFGYARPSTWVPTAADVGAVPVGQVMSIIVNAGEETENAFTVYGFEVT